MEVDKSFLSSKPPRNQGGKDFFSIFPEFTNTKGASQIAGVDYQKFTREFGNIPYGHLHPGGPRIYKKETVRNYFKKTKKEKRNENTP